MDLGVESLKTSEDQRLPLLTNTAPVLSQRSSPTSSVLSHVSVEAPDKLVEEVISLSGEYNNILAKVITDLDKKVQSHELDINVIARFINLCLDKKHTPLSTSDTVEDVFYPVTQEFSYIYPHLDLLYGLDERCCNGNHQAKLRRYAARVKQFRKSTTVKDFIKLIKNERLSLRKTPRKRSEAEIVIKVGDEYSEKTVNNVLKLKEKIFDRLSFNFGLVSVHHSILTIVYSIPLDLVTRAITVVKEKIPQLEPLGVISVRIADTLIVIREVSAEATDCHTSSAQRILPHTDKTTDSFLKGKYACDF